MEKKKIFGRIIILLLIGILYILPSFADETVEYLRYGKEKVRLDIYNPYISNSPVVIVIHGGAGIRGDRVDRYKKFGNDLMKKGIIAINVYYFDSTRRNWVKTIIKTVDYAQSIPEADKEKIGLIGYSLGGTIAFKVASKDKRVKLLAVNVGSLPPEFTREDAAKLPKTLMISGTEDSSIHSLYKLKEWFVELNKPLQIKIDEGYGHFVPMELFYENWRTIVKFFTDNF